MPLITTHNQFAKEVLQKCEEKIRRTFKQEQKLFELFAQGFDPLFFYELLPFTKERSNYCHTHYTDDFFLNFIALIKEKKETNNQQILASLYGHITHYVLDSTVHPFIIYKTGEYEKQKPETLKNNGKHTKMEMQIDKFIYEQKYKQKFATFKIHKHLITKEKWSKELTNLLDENYEKTFQIKKGGRKYRKGILIMYYAYKFLIEDKTGIKTKIYKQIDKLTPKKEGVFANYSSHVTSIDYSIFNLEHKVLFNPYNKTIKSTESFFDLYDKALTNCLLLFKATHNYLENKITKQQYKNILQDKSYTSGLPWDKYKKIKYLEF